MKKPRGRKWHKYSPEYKRAAVDRLVAGESATVVANELGIRTKFLYAWRAAGYGTKAVGKPKRKSVISADPEQDKIRKLEQQVEDLQRLAGQQAAELDFFDLALRATGELRPKKRVNFAAGSTPQSRA